MINEYMFYIKQDYLSLEYLKYNSNWFEILRKNPKKNNQFIDSVKSKYKLTTIDKINKISERINMISSIMDIMS